VLAYSTASSLALMKPLRWLKRGFVAVVLLGAVLTLSVMLTWEPDRQLGQLAARWAPPPSKFVELGGMQVHIRDEGPRDDPEPLVLLHGLAASLHTWEGWSAGLRGQRRVISVDLPGFGLTGPSPQGDYHIEAYTRFVLQLLDSMGIERCVLIGNALGGEIAWQTAWVAPKRVSALVLVDAYGYPVSPLSVPLAFRLMGTPAMQWYTDRVMPRSVVESSVRNVFGDASRVRPEVVDRYFQLALRVGNRRALRQRFEQTVNGAQASRIATLKVPTLILWGGRDGLVPPDHAERFKADIAGSRLVVFGDLGHIPMEEDPVRTLAPVKAFLGLK
jgi:pimeloyl-ACP methyl ester carboxylesterase